MKDRKKLNLGARRPGQVRPAAIRCLTPIPYETYPGRLDQATQPPSHRRRNWTLGLMASWIVIAGGIIALSGSEKSEASPNPCAAGELARVQPGVTAPAEAENIMLGFDIDRKYSKNYAAQIEADNPSVTDAGVLSSAATILVRTACTDPNANIIGETQP